MFRGAVAVSMDIKALDINQCPGDYYTPNAFKRTHKCDDKTSYVSLICLFSEKVFNVLLSVCANPRKRIQDWRI